VSHTNQFAIRDRKFGLLESVLVLAAEECRSSDVVKVAGVCGQVQAGICRAELAVRLGYDAALLSLADLKDETILQLLEHARVISNIIPIIGFTLAARGWRRLLPYEFWRQLVEIENGSRDLDRSVHRYQTLTWFEPWRRRAGPRSRSLHRTTNNILTTCSRS